MSWIISDESFFPKYQWLDQFRLRTRVRRVGRAAGRHDRASDVLGDHARREHDDAGQRDGHRPAGAPANALGNPNLKPETSSEFEGGFESRMFNNRATVDFTYYNKKTKDALIAQPIAASAAPSATTITRKLRLDHEQRASKPS